MSKLWIWLEHADASAYIIAVRYKKFLKIKWGSNQMIQRCETDGNTE